jgi:hypothetical protein
MKAGLPGPDRACPEQADSEAAAGQRMLRRNIAHRPEPD